MHRPFAVEDLPADADAGWADAPGFSAGKGVDRKAKLFAKLGSGDPVRQQGLWPLWRRLCFVNHSSASLQAPPVILAATL